MVFVLNNQWSGHFLDIEQHPLKLELLEYFTELRKLFIVPSRLQSYAVPLEFNTTTFEGCKKITELHINIPLIDIDLYYMVKPLKNLQILDFTDVKGISYQNMTKIMAGVSKNIEKLWMSHFQTIGQSGYLTVLRANQFFNGTFNKLNDVVLSNNGFAVVHTGWYKATPNLRYLDISYNGLTFIANYVFAAEALMHPSLTVLNISHQGFYNPLNRENSLNFIFDNASDADIKIKDSVEPENQSGSIFGEMFRCTNKITQGNITRLFGKDTRIFCDALRSCTFPSCKNFPCEVLPPLGDLIDQDCGMWIRLPLGKNLTEINTSHNYLDPLLHTGVILHGTICFTDTKIRKIDFSGNYLWAASDKIGESVNRINKVVGMEHLSDLNLSKNDFSLNISSVAATFTNLTQFSMAQNFANFTPGASLCSDNSMHNLRSMDISYNHLTNNNFNLQILKNCAELVNLSLSGNNFDSTLFINLEGANNLRRIDLSSNNIQTISEAFQMELDRAGNITINISNNHLICGCKEESMAFIKWIDSENRKTKLADAAELLCVGTNGQRSLTSVKYADLWKECSIFVPIIASITTSLGVVCVIAVVTSAYRSRFRIQYKLFTFQKWLNRRIRRRDTVENEQNYEYDAFVSYSSEDRFWVHDVLMKTLEEKYGFKLMIHYRDILPGENIQQAIDDRMRKSREYILVFTKNFFESDWCPTEMEEAYRESLRRHKNLAVIVLGDVPTGIDNPTAVTILDQHSYLQWELKEDDEKNTSHRRKLFWAKLVHHLYGNRDSICCCACCSFGPRAIGYREVRAHTGNEYESLVRVPVQQYGSISESYDTFN